MQRCPNCVEVGTIETQLDLKLSVGNDETPTIVRNLPTRIPVYACLNSLNPQSEGGHG